jgi:hypothetical protein
MRDTITVTKVKTGPRREDVAWVVTGSTLRHRSKKLAEQIAAELRRAQEAK